MKITHLGIKNFRLLKDIGLSLEEKSTIVVGRNNSGKTSLTEIFRRLLSDKNPQFSLYDFNISCIGAFKEALSKKIAGCEFSEVRNMLPFIEIKIKIEYAVDDPDLGALSDFIIDLNPDCNEALIVIRYQLEDGRIEDLFEDIENDLPESKLKFIKLLRERIPKLFGTKIFAQDPNDVLNISQIEYPRFKELMGAGFINAQRGLDDVTHADNDVLGKVLGKLFKSASNASAPDDMREKSEQLNQVISAIQTTVDTDFSQKLNALLPALKIFGYPGLADPDMSTETTLNIENILDSHTKIRYGHGDGIFLPEAYNGLGSRNLIYMLFQLFEFFRDWQIKPVNNGLYLVFIEEPEAHLHPQMQQVFVKQINQIVTEFSNTMNQGKQWPVQFVITTHSTHIANETRFEAIRYFLTSRNEQTETRIKDLRAEFDTPDVKADKEFLHKYLTLTRCDLFFCDKAMLIEGPTERILMPVLIEKVDNGIEPNLKLKSQYISVVEVGGAYAHHFYKFLDFLELRTLIITDLDSVKKTKGEKTTSYPACAVSEGTHSSNAGIKQWFNKDGEGYMPLKECMEIKADLKINAFRRIAFQIPEEKKTSCGRSFEDAFMLANIELFGITGETDEEIALKAYQEAEDIGKTNFALKYALEETRWTPPLYIKEGLEWLSVHSNVAVTVVQKVMAELAEDLKISKDA